MRTFSLPVIGCLAMTLTLGMDTKLDCKDLASAGLLDVLFFAAGTAQQAADAGDSAQTAPPVPGPAGPQGEQGPQGDPGADGSDGTDGSDGADGTDGGDGKDGASGEPGAAGEPGTAGEQGDQGDPGRDLTGLLARGVIGRDATIISGQKILAVRRGDQPGDSGEGRYEVDVDVSGAEAMPQNGGDFVVFVSIRGTFEQGGEDGKGQQDIIIANHTIEGFDPNATPATLTVRVETFNLIDNFFDDADFTIEVLEP